MQSKKTGFKTCFFGLIGWILSKEAFDEIRILRINLVVMRNYGKFSVI